MNSSRPTGHGGPLLGVGCDRDGLACFGGHHPQALHDTNGGSWFRFR